MIIEHAVRQSAHRRAINDAIIQLILDTSLSLSNTFNTFTTFTSFTTFTTFTVFTTSTTVTSFTTLTTWRARYY